MISGAAKRALFDAAKRFPVAILSGRSLDELHAIADIPRVFYAASYGLDIAGPDLRLQHPFATETLPALDAAGKRLQTQIEKIQGARIERERFEIVVRYELASDNDVPRIEALVDEVNRSLPQLRKTVGSRTLALRPDMDWDKGHALRWLLSALDLEGAGLLPIYVGDDPADEDAFQALRTIGVGVLVSERAHPSMAEFRVEGPQQVVDLIRALTRAHETLAPGERMPT
jgi:alpha,alpha-trehalase